MENKFLRQAELLKPKLIHRKRTPCGIVRIIQDDSAFQKVRAATQANVSFPVSLTCGEPLTFDFGEHTVGYLSFALNHISRIADSPVMIRLSFGETPYEISRNPEEYHGTLGCGWLQNEVKSFVTLPCRTSTERRYAFRYVRLERIDNAKFPVMITNLFCDSVSSADVSSAKKYNGNDDLLKNIYSAAIKTLGECEQDVFEDGPKRDRRLWTGDLRLQALTDAKVFANKDLVKRCLYLFAAHRIDGRIIAPYVFPDSPPYVDGWYFADYSLFFISCIYDYVEAYGDKVFAAELYDVALGQIEWISETFDRQSGIINDNFFVDWCPSLDKSTAGVAIYLYVLKQMLRIAEVLGRDTDFIKGEIKAATQALEKCFDPDLSLFVAKSGQISWHSQIWGVLAEVFDGSKNREILKRIAACDTEYTIRTPYMMHCYIEALYNSSMKQEALMKIREYWGNMLNAGFDCFPEVFNPGNEFESPYGDAVINSSCHAWSCTPAYWLQKFASEANSD